MSYLVSPLPSLQIQQQTAQVVQWLTQVSFFLSSRYATYLMTHLFTENPHSTLACTWDMTKTFWITSQRLLHPDWGAMVLWSSTSRWSDLGSSEKQKMLPQHYGILWILITLTQIDAITWLAAIRIWRSIFIFSTHSSFLETISLGSRHCIFLTSRWFTGAWSRSLARRGVRKALVSILMSSTCLSVILLVIRSCLMDISATNPTSTLVSSLWREQSAVLIRRGFCMLVAYWPCPS